MDSSLLGTFEEEVEEEENVDEDAVDAERKDEAVDEGLAMMASRNLESPSRND